jgi:uncharacterized membrane protein
MIRPKSWVLIWVSPACLSATQLIPLESIPFFLGGSVTSISTDGSTVTGYAPNSGSPIAVTWNSGGTVTLKGPGAIWDLNSTADVFVGESNNGKPTIWKNGANGVPILTTQADGAAFSVTADGMTSYGAMIPSQFVWTGTKFDHALQQSQLIDPPCYAVYRVTPDGKTIVGDSSTGNDEQAFRRKENNAFDDLGTLFGGSSVAQDVSDNGEVVVGVSDGKFFKWTIQTGMIDLGPFHSGSFNFRDISVSGDGKTIVGAGGSNDCFVWDEHNGTRNLSSVLQTAGINMSGWKLDRVGAISFDGDVIAGEGTQTINGTEDLKSWMVRGFSRLLPPQIKIESSGDLIIIRFSGILQESDDLGITDLWSDVESEPTAKYVIQLPITGRKFYRARSF